MFDFFKWFWVSISFRNWTFEGVKLANPFLIILRLLLMPVIKIVIFFVAFLFLICGDRYNAEQIISDWM